MSGSAPPSDASIRLVLIGARGVGKTLLVRQLISSGPAESIERGNLLECRLSVELGGEASGRATLSVLDTHGEPRYLSDTMFLVNRHKPDAIVLVFSLIDARSFKALSDRLQRLQSWAGASCQTCFLVGNKADLVPTLKSNREIVTEKQIKEFLTQHPQERYFQISAVEDSGKQVVNTFEQIAHQLLMMMRSKGARAAEPGGVFSTPQPPKHGKTWVKLIDLLQQTQPVEARDELGRSALSIAAMLGNLKNLSQLLASSQLCKPSDCDVDYLAMYSRLVDEADNAGMTPLMLSVAHGHVDTIDVLHKMGADLNKEDNLSFTALTHAAVCNNSQAVTKLLALKAEPHKKEFCGNTPLIWAARCGHAQVILELRNCLAELHQWLHKGEYGMDASQWAQYFGHAECHKLIVESVANLMQTDSRGDPAGSVGGVASMLLHSDDQHPAIESRRPWYTMQRSRRGYALIINIIDYDCPPELKLTKRDGAEFDFHEEQKSLHHAFLKMGFMPHIYLNKKKSFFSDIMSHNGCSLSEYEDHDAFLLCICGHGGDGFVYASDGDRVNLEDVFNQVRQTLGLQNKPKLFFIQSCRSPEDQPVFADPAGIEAASVSPQEASFAVHKKHEDCYYAYSVVPGNVSNRDTLRGCLFAQSLRDVLLDEDTDLRVDEFTSLMPTVVDQVADWTNDRQIPSSTSTLRKLLYFPPLPCCNCVSREVS